MKQEMISLSNLVNSAAIDEQLFRATLGHYASGITIVTGKDGGKPIGFTCQSFYSASIDPPLVSLSVMRSSTSYPRIARTGRFCVNVLADDQHRVSSQFARSGTDKWEGIDWTESSSGNPVIADTLMWLDCDLWAEHEAGDHVIVLGRVVEHGASDLETREPLVYYKGAYRRLGLTGPEEGGTSAPA